LEIFLLDLILQDCGVGKNILRSFLIKPRDIHFGTLFLYHEMK